jgi:aspartyl-tRNA(Asn)/glutamyl-tRNA(Gln) amidotransferase subunit A
LTEVWELGVEELVTAIGAGELGVVEVVRAFIDRAALVDPILHCFVALDPEASDRAAALGGAADRRPLHGVPYAYKDVFVRRGAMPTVGAPNVPLEIRARDASVLRRLDAAGAVSLGALNLDPFAYAATGANPDLGDTRNPWDPARIAGGSSGGAAAAVAAGAVPFAIGTDAGGSIRIPAALCGVTGLKPTLGRIPKAGSVPLTYSQDTVGILARSARDVAIVLQQAAGHDPSDAASIPVPVPDVADVETSCAGTTFGVDPDEFAARTSPEIAAAVDPFLATVERLGGAPVEVDLSMLDGFDAAATVLTWAEVGAVHERTFRAEPASYPPTIRARLELALAAHGVDHVNALRLQGRALGQLLDGPLAAADVLVVPAVAAPATTIGSVGRDPVGVSVGHLRLNRPFNFTGVPAVTIPVGFDPEGMPIGLQLVGRPWAERTLLACAAAYQAATDHHRRLPPLSRPSATDDRPSV